MLSDRLVDLLSDFDTNTDLSSDTIGRLRLLRLAHLCINKTEIRQTSDLGIVEKVMILPTHDFQCGRFNN